MDKVTDYLPPGHYNWLANYLPEGVKHKDVTRYERDRDFRTVTYYAYLKSGERAKLMTAYKESIETA